MTEVALALPLEDAARLAADAPRYGHRVIAECAGADELATRIPALRPEVALVAATPQYLSARLVAACDDHGVRLLVVGDTAGARRFANSVGVIDPIAPPVAWEMLGPHPVVAVPAPEIAIAPGPRSRPARGRVIAVWGPHGAPGRTSLAISIAAEFAAAGWMTTLADADTHAAAVAPALGLLDEAPGFAAACRLAGLGSLTDAEFERVAETRRIAGGSLRVLTGLGRPQRWPEISTERVSGVLAAIRDWSEVTVVDTAAPLDEDEELSSDVAAPRRNAATLAVLDAADQVVAVGAADPVGLSRFVRAHADLLERVAPDRVTVVVTKLRAGVIGLGPAAQVRQTLERFGGIRDPILVPWDPTAFDGALVSGRTLVDVAPRSPARQAIRTMVRERLGADRG